MPPTLFSQSQLSACRVLTMLSVLIALIALFTPTVVPENLFNISKSTNATDEYLVDLDYQLNRGQAVQGDSLVAFRNVRFAAPPLGPLRFTAPAPPPVDRSTIQSPADVICPQAFPRWLTKGAVGPFGPSDIPPVDPRTSEDCLFLDVLLPKAIWETRRQARAPVLVWIYGGGFDVGWKDASGRGYGLVSRSPNYGGQGVILVSLNYRLGLFGWLNGADVTSNAGLLDQRFALDWIQKYIHLFGGDRSQVTILGESAGASSIQAHLTAYGGTKGPSPFKGAIPQSPYFLPTTPQPNSQVDAVLRFGKVSSLTALRQMSSADLQRLNALLVGNSQPFGTFTFGIVTDNDYVPDMPSKLLAQGRFDRRVAVMTGHNQDEGSRFVPNTLITDEASYEAFLKSLIPQLARSSSSLRQITQVLYPPIFDGSQGYTTQVERNNLTIADMTIVCNARFMDQAPFVRTYAYEYDGVHGADLTNTFYDFGSVSGVNATLAKILQGYLTRFAISGQPNAPTLPSFPPAEQGLTVQYLGNEFVGPIKDEEGIKQLPERCRYWQSTPYLSANSWKF